MWEIVTYGNNEGLNMVLNGIAAIVQSGDYLLLLRTVALIAFVVGMLSAAFSQKFSALNWIVSMFVVYTFFFGIRTQVIVIDRLTLQPAVTVANVPVGFAFLASTTNKVGDYFTRAFETVFSIPNELKYQGQGIMFGARILDASRRFEIRDGRLKKYLNNFVRNCVYYDILQGTYTLTDLQRSLDIWTTVSATNPGRFTTDIDGDVVDCQFAHADITAIYLPTAIDEARAYYGGQVNPHLVGNALLTATFNSQVEAAYQQMVGVARTSSELILQNMMINLLDDSGLIISQELNDPASAQLGMSVAHTRAVANSNYRTMAKIAEEALPMVRNSIEILLIAVGPFLLLLFLMPMQTAVAAIKGYAMTMLWIQLWPMLYAVANLVMTLAAGRSFLASNGALTNVTIQTAMDLGQSIISNQAVAGWLVVSIPVIAGALVKGLASGLEGLSSSMMQPVQGAAAGAATAAATGNLSYGAVNYQTESAFNRTMFKDQRALSMEDAGSATVSDAKGRSQWDSSGHYIEHANPARGLITGTVNMQGGERYAARSQEALGTAITNLAQLNSSRGRGEERTLNFQKGSDHISQQMNSVREGLVERLSKDWGRERANQIVDDIMIGGSAGLGTPGSWSPVKIAGQISSNHRDADSTKVAESLRVAKDYLTEKGFTSQEQFTRTLQQTEAYRDAVRSNDEFANNVHANLQRAREYALAGEFFASAAANVEMNAGKLAQDFVGERGYNRFNMAENPMIAKQAAAEFGVHLTQLANEQAETFARTAMKETGYEPAPVPKQFRGTTLTDSFNGARESMESESIERGVPMAVDSSVRADVASGLPKGETSVQQRKEEVKPPKHVQTEAAEVSEQAQQTADNIRKKEEMKKNMFKPNYDKEYDDLGY